MVLLRLVGTLRGLAQLKPQARYLTGGPPKKNAPYPRHLLSIADLKHHELDALIQNASHLKRGEVLALKHNRSINNLVPRRRPKFESLAGHTVAMLFNKRSTRTRVSTEAAVAAMGGHSMFLGKDDIQLGVNESLYDTSLVISSMTSCIVARVGPHSDVADLAKHSKVPVINALSNDYHPLQTITDFQTIYDDIRYRGPPGSLPNGLDGLDGLDGLKIAWIGDSNNVLYDLAIGAVKLGVHISVASPAGYGIPESMRATIQASAEGVPRPGKLSETTIPEEAIKDADILMTDTWVSMGQEEETAKRIKDFEGYQITDELAKRGGAKEGWKFMHCMPRHPEEVADEVFYGPRSLVFTQAENRLWAARAVLEAFVVQRGMIWPTPELGRKGFRRLAQRESSQDGAVV